MNAGEEKLEAVEQAPLTETVAADDQTDVSPRLWRSEVDILLPVVGEQIGEANAFADW